jgi:iron complex outermembrane receptor protein
MREMYVAWRALVCVTVLLPTTHALAIDGQQSSSGLIRLAQADQGQSSVTTPQAVVPGADTTGLQEIVVTATRRTTRLVDTPMSISALSSTDMEQNRVLTMDDVAQQVSGLTYMPQSGSETFLAIRGAATIDDSTGTDQGVSMFVDDIVRVSVADLQPELFDMDRVEVLKGPQGTLFGRNSIAGVVALYTKDPTYKTEGAVKVGYGSYNLTEFKGMFNTPLIDDKLALRVVVTRHANDGYIEDLTTHNDLGNEESWAARMKILFTPSDDVRFVGGAEYFQKHASNPSWLLGNFQPALLPPLTFNPTQTQQLNPGRIDQSIWGLSGRLDWITGVGTVTSITGYRHLNVFDETLETADPFNTEIFDTTEWDNQVTEELRLASPTDQRLSWVSGVYYLHSNKTRPLEATFNVIPNSYIASIIDSTPPVLYQAFQDTRTISYAAFGDAAYALTSTWKLDVGARYTREQKAGRSALNRAFGPVGPPISGVYSDAWSAFTPKATLTYQPSPELMTYATVSEGFQSGGFNLSGSTDAGLTAGFKPEYMWNYEAGVKFDGLEHHLQVNVSAFLDRYRDLQIIEYDGATLTTNVSNAGKASVSGFESEITAAPLRWLTLGVKYDHLDSKFTSYVINNGPGLPLTDFTGNQLPFTPTNQVVANAELHFQLPQDRGRIAFGGDYTYRNPMWLTVANAIPPNDTPAFLRDRTAWRGVVNLHSSWSSKDDRWELTFWGKNVTNRQFLNFAVDQTLFFESPDEANNPTNHIFNARLANPRWWGVNLQFKL